MQTLIKTLKNALVKPDRFIDKLRSQSAYHFREAYTVAVVHHEKRLKEKDVAVCLRDKGYLDADGYTFNEYDEKMLTDFRNCAPDYVKKISLMCFGSEAQEMYTFKEKYAGDYWKKIVDPGNFEAVIEYVKYDQGEDICKIEFELRELMRSSKEVPSLKVLPYVWVVRVPKEIDISRILQHYYGDNYEIFEGESETTAIGWSKTLQEVNMRYFVCPPA